MRIRFVTCDDPFSDLIRAREGDMARWVGFTPSHAELAGFTTTDGKPGYLGAHDDGGVMVRPVGYDAATLTHELFVDVALPAENAACIWALSKVGSPYDWHAIIDYLVPDNFHEPNHFICSALCTGALERGGAFTYLLALPWHLVSPALLLLWLSGRTKINAKAA